MLIALQHKPLLFHCIIILQETPNIKSSKKEKEIKSSIDKYKMSITSNERYCKCLFEQLVEIFLANEVFRGQ